MVKAGVFSEGDMDRVEFYIDVILRDIDTDMPYKWLWDEFIIGVHEIKVVAYDREGNADSNGITVSKFF
jgi:hypothetical protein